MSSERHEFQAEVKQLLDLMIHSLYSNRDVFLRELISNASDALDKLRFEQLTHPDLASTDEPQIRIEIDREKRTIAIADNGIGMSRNEVIANIGTIAKSGTKEFMGALANASAKGDKAAPELIGQFGVGFYSGFMVADRIELVTRRAGEAGATRWESGGDGAYVVDDATREHAGTTVTLHLRPADAEHGLADYTDDKIVSAIVKRYSDFVAYPIRLGAEVLNSMKAIWDRSKAEVSDDDYKQFYRHVSHDWNDPLRSIPVKIEGTFEANALLFIPSKAPFDLYNPEMKRGLQLYVKRVFVMDECKDLLPPYLRFVRGVVDAHDLSLNVSREILQKDRQIQVIRKQLVKKVLATLGEVQRDAADTYMTFWTELGPVLKEGLLAGDADKDKLLDLVMAESTRGSERTSLADYVGRMKDGQDAIYFLVGPSQEHVAKSPLLEAFAAKGFEVLLFSDAIDELWLENAPAFRDKPLKSISRGDINLGGNDAAAQPEQYADLLTCLRVHLQDEVKEVRLSQRLASSPVCLVQDENDLSPRMQRMMEQLGHAAPKPKRILEVNPSHPIVGKLQAIYAASKADPRLSEYAKLLLGQAHLAESGVLPDPAAFSQVLTEVMLRSA